MATIQVKHIDRGKNKGLVRITLELYITQTDFSKLPGHLIQQAYSVIKTYIQTRTGDI